MTVEETQMVPETDLIDGQVCLRKVWLLQASHTSGQGGVSLKTGFGQVAGEQEGKWAFDLHLVGQSPPGAQQQSEGGKTAPGPAHTSSEGADLEEEAPAPATPLEEVGPLIIAPVPCRIHLQQLAADSRC
ncbi:hypothetical protein ACRRTK_004547 [Alexandromys fortis]